MDHGDAPARRRGAGGGRRRRRERRRRGRQRPRQAMQDSETKQGSLTADAWRTIAPRCRRQAATIARSVASPAQAVATSRNIGCAAACHVAAQQQRARLCCGAATARLCRDSRLRYSERETNRGIPMSRSIFRRRAALSPPSPCWRWPRPRPPSPRTTPAARRAGGRAGDRRHRDQARDLAARRALLDQRPDRGGHPALRRATRSRTCRATSPASPSRISGRARARSRSAASPPARSSATSRA